MVTPKIDTSHHFNEAMSQFGERGYFCNGQIKGEQADLVLRRYTR